MFSTKNWCSIVPAPLFFYIVPYLHQLAAVEYKCRKCPFLCNFGKICIKFGANLAP